MLAPTAAVLVIGALASLNSSETNGVVATAVLGRDEPGAAFPDKRFSVFTKEPATAKYAGVEVGGEFVARMS